MLGLWGARTGSIELLTRKFREQMAVLALAMLWASMRATLRACPRS